MEYLDSKEQDVRKRVLGAYNKKRRDFPTEELYDVYLEQIEEKI